MSAPRFDDWLAAAMAGTGPHTARLAPAGLLAGVARGSGAHGGTVVDVSFRHGWDLAWESARWQEASSALLSVRKVWNELFIGPLWLRGSTTSCAGCVEVRGLVAMDHPLLGHHDRPYGGVSALPVGLAETSALIAANGAEHPLAADELIVVGPASARRHRVRRAFSCPVCGSDRTGPARSDEQALWRPEPLTLRSQPSGGPVPVRSRLGGVGLDQASLREHLVDPRFGPVLGVLRDVEAPFAMCDAVVPESRNMGYGRGLTVAEAEPVAILEAYERLGGFPHHGRVVRSRSQRSLGCDAIDATRLGRYTERQLADPSCRVLPWDEDTESDWVWGHDLSDGTPRLVPADVGFYLYEYEHRLDYHGSRRAGAATRRRNYFDESSSGCALGSSVEEAAVHSLLELAERDAFLMAWHCGQPLPRIDLSTVTDPVSRQLLALIESRGFDAHLLVASNDLRVPVVWGCAVNRGRKGMASFSAAGSSADPEGAVRAALWELGQIVAKPLDLDAERLRPMLDDPWRVETLEDHFHLYTLPETLPVVEKFLDGPVLPLAEAFPGWPEALAAHAQGDVRGALDYLANLFGAAGLDEIVLVDQSTRDHLDLGLRVVKAVVPGIIPMCFGYAQQRLTGLPRLRSALRAAGVPTDPLPTLPHPFP
ncbi:YcaO-like family protein [Kitasatospora sp. NPDC004669]|uniref:YcaO-like family protein n=1 Tax=Kitasatospora sp. NPDC004669 TaxID=3154555 RepID=UPI0033BF48FE